jgi:hypothetical protein
MQLPSSSSTHSLSYSVAEHFASVGEIWDAFFDGAISMVARERLLAVFRARLAAEVPAPK